MDTKTILITGCSSGIGLDTALILKDDGYRVFASARDLKDVQILKDKGFEAFYIDVTKKESITKALEEILELTDGTLYALFNNAGFGQPGALEDVPTQALREQFETNLFGLHELTTQVIPIMRKQGYGRIMQHSSVLGIISLKFRGAYNSSKYAIEGHCDTLRLELMDTNIFVSSINTGPVTSDFRKNATKKYYQYIHKQDTVFRDEYNKDLLGHETKKEKDPFTRSSKVVIKNIKHALESKKPKARYYNTEATYLLGTLKRLLSASLLDKILMKI